MKFQRFGKLNPNLKLDYKPMALADTFVLRRVNCLLDLLQEKEPEAYQEFIEKLLLRLQATSLDQGYLQNKAAELLSFSESYPHLEDKQELVRLELAFFIQDLAISEESFWQNEPLKAPIKNFNHSAFRPLINNLLTLVELFGKEQAITYYKAYTRRYNDLYDTNQKNIYKDLHQMRAEDIQVATTCNLGRIRLIGEVENGRYIVLRKSCEKLIGIEDFNVEDRDLLDTIACYCHFSLTSFWNEHFVLTQEYTLAKGSPYCEYVFHDTRIVDKVEHPPREFFEKAIVSEDE